METPDAGVDAPTEPVPDAAEQGPTDRFGFTEIRCLPDLAGGEVVVEGQRLTCGFRVTGESAVPLQLSCEDGSGAPVDCGPGGEFEIEPLTPRAPPFEGTFSASTSGLAGDRVSAVWIVDDGEDYAEHRFEADVQADDGINEPPSIVVICGEDGDGEVEVTAGDTLECTLRLTDPDPDVLRWQLTQTDGPDPVADPSPEDGVVPAPAELSWRWSTFVPDANHTFTFEFEVDDLGAAPVAFELAVTVLP